MLALIVEFRVKSTQVAAFDTAITENARTSRETEPGCRQFDVCRDPHDAQLFFLYELYDNQAAIDAHLRSAHFQAMNAQTADWIESKVVRSYVRRSPTR